MDRHYKLAPEPLSEEARRVLTGSRDKMMSSKGTGIEGQVLEAIKEVLNFNDPKTIKASLILARIRTILGLKDLASAPDLCEGLKDALQEICRLCVRLNPQHENCKSCEDMTERRKALAKAEGKKGGDR